MKTVMNWKKTLCFILTLAMLAALFVPAAVVVTSEGTPVAKLTKQGEAEGTTYTSFADAWAALSEGCTLTLLEDAEINAQLSTAVNNFAIDGNHKTLKTIGNLNPALILQGTGIVINDLSVIVDTENGGHRDTQPLKYDVSNAAYTLTMNNVTVKAVANDALVIMGGVVTLNDCNLHTDFNSCIQPKLKNQIALNINGGYYSRSDGATNATYAILFLNQTENCVVTVKDATFREYNLPMIRRFKHQSLDTNNVVKVYGGTFISDAQNLFESGTLNALDIVGAHIISNSESGNPTLDKTASGVLTTTAVSYSALQKGGIVTDANVKDQYLAPNGKTYFTTQNTIDLLDGASVRLVKDSNGIRFSSVVTKATIDAIDAIKDAGTEISYGTVIVPTDYIEGDTSMPALTKGLLAKAGKEYIDIKAKDGILTNADGDVMINAAMVNIQPDNRNRNFSAVSYVNFFKDGKEVTVYSAYDSKANSRNAYEIAVEALADTDTTYTPEQREALNTYVEAGPPSYKNGILGNDPSLYQIVLPKNCAYSELRFATRLQALMTQKYGATLPIVYDDAAAADYEVLIGATARTTETAVENTFLLTAVQNRVEILGDSAYAYEYAYEYFKGDSLKLLAQAPTADGRLYTGDIEPLLQADKAVSVYQKSGQYRIMDFNILGTDDGQPYDIRNKMLAEAVLTLKPDILTVNEMTAEMRSEANASIIPVLKANGYEEADIGTDTLTTIFWRKDVFTALTQGVKDMTDGAGITKQVAWVVLEDHTTGKQLGVIATHLAHQQDADGNGNTYRLEMLEKVMEVVSAMETGRGCPMLIAGDMNCSQGSDPYQVFLENGFEDVRDIATLTDTGATNYHENPDYDAALNIWERPRGDQMYAAGIDHIFAKYENEELSFGSFDVLTDPFTSSISDHAPVVVDFDLN